jgi:hypothetical protein
LCSGRTAGLNLSFGFAELAFGSVPAPFLCYFLLALKESKEEDLDEQRKNKEKTKKEQKNK